MQEKTEKSERLAMFDKICKICNRKFKGWINSQICDCKECKKKAKAIIDKRYYEKGKWYIETIEAGYKKSFGKDKKLEDYLIEHWYNKLYEMTKHVL